MESTVVTFFVPVIKELERSLEEQTQINEKKKVIDERVAALLDAVKSLHKVYGGDLPATITKQIDGDLGITDQVREAMKAQIPGNAPANFQIPWLQPLQVRSLVEQRGFDLGGYSNPMAVIHQVLKRLEKQGEVEYHTQSQTYRWKRK